MIFSHHHHTLHLQACPYIFIFLFYFIKLNHVEVNRIHRGPDNIFGVRGEGDCRVSILSVYRGSGVYLHIIIDNIPSDCQI